MRHLWLGLAIVAIVSLECGAAENAPAAAEITALLNQLKSSKPEERIAAADALSKYGPAAKDTVPALLEAATGQVWVDTAMLSAVQKMGPAVETQLFDLLENGKPEVRGRAAIALWICGQDREKLLAAAKKYAHDKDPRVQSTMERIANKFQAEGAAAASVTTPQAEKPQPKDIPAQKISTSTDAWPEFHGPNRDSICTETSLLKEWPADGPKLLWRCEGMGSGMSTVSIAGGKIYTTGDLKDKGQCLICLDLKTHQKLWATPVGEAYRDFGALSTPTVEGKWVYATSTDGGVFCLDGETGAVRWKKSMTKDFGGSMMSVWKFSESPLLDGGKLICTPGAKDAALVALNKETGELIWKCAIPDLGKAGKDGAGYSSVIVADIAGVRQYVQLLGRGLIGVAADSGKFLWGYNRIANEVANISHPLVRGSYVFCSTSYGVGSVLLKISRAGETFKAEEAYFTKQFDNHHGGIVMLGDYIYGGSGLNAGAPTCLNFLTGEIAWKAKPPEGGSAATLYADGNLIFRYDRGPVYLVAATPKDFEVKGHFTPPLAKGPAWAHPVIFDKKLFLRHDDLLLCYDLAAESGK
jgi:outer membrane protein assembly factor BamB